MFLYFERKEMPLHIGSVVILDGAFDAGSEQLFAARLPEIPRYRQRAVFAPLNLTHPCWEYDPDFDIRNHVHRVALDPPGSEEQLSDLAGRVFTPLMDRSKPLWDVTVVDGLDHGRSALVCRVHHSMMDGVSGMTLVNALFDASREPRRVEPQVYHSPPLPDPTQVLVEGLASTCADVASRFIGAQISLLRLFEAYAGDTSKTSLRGLWDTMPELLRPADRLPFNRPCSGERGYCWTAVPFAEVRAIRTALGGTLNDVILAVVTGAISRYVAAHREPVKNRFARLLVPVNARPAGENGSAGNQISMLPLSVPLGIEDPLERIQAVMRRANAMKNARIADVIALIGTWLGWIPPQMQQSLAAMPFLPQPVLMFNLVCTNVPGPMVPLYANGRELLTYYPHVPCGSDVGIGVAISSYNKGLYFGVTYDGEAAPDGEIFRDFLVETYQELRAAAGVAPVAFGMPSRRVAAAAEPEQPAVEGPQQDAQRRAAESALQTGAAAEPEQSVAEGPQQDEQPRAAEAALQTAEATEPEQPATEGPEQAKPPRVAEAALQTGAAAEPEQGTALRRAAEAALQTGAAAQTERQAVQAPQQREPRRAAEAAQAVQAPQQEEPPRAAEAALQTGAAAQTERQAVQAPQQGEPRRAAEAALQTAAATEPEQPAAEAPQQDKPPRRAAVPERPAREVPQPEEPAAVAPTAPEAEPAAAPDPAPARQARARNHRGRRAGAAKAGQNPR